MVKGVFISTTVVVVLVLGGIWIFGDLGSLNQITYLVIIGGAFVFSFFAFGPDLGPRPERKPMRPAAPQSKVIVGFVIYPEDTVAGAAEQVIDSRPGALGQRLQTELSAPDTPVTIYQPQDWTPPPVVSQNSIYENAVLTGLIDAAIARVVADGVAWDIAEQAFGAGEFETLFLPSGRVVLFKELTGPTVQLGQLS
ncbi:MAG: hypothetical protein AAF557_24065 [Pseudomonadota bacterium]